MCSLNQRLRGKLDNFGNAEATILEVRSHAFDLFYAERVLDDVIAEEVGYAMHVGGWNHASRLQIGESGDIAQDLLQLSALRFHFVIFKFQCGKLGRVTNIFLCKTHGIFAFWVQISAAMRSEIGGVTRGILMLFKASKAT